MWNNIPEEALQLLPTPSAWLLYFVCALLIGMSKTGIQNIGTVAVPFFAILFGAKYSTGIVLIMLCMADLIAVIYYRKQFVWAEVIKLIPAASVGLLVGLLVGNYIDDKLFKIVMGVCILIGVIIMFWSSRQEEHRVNQLTQQKWYSPLFGFVVGFSTMIGNAAGPALSVYLLSKRLDKYAFVATGAWFIMILNFTKIPLQLFVWDNLSWSGFILNLVALPFIMLGGILGIRIVKKLQDTHFKLIVTVLVILSSVLLILM